MVYAILILFIMVMLFVAVVMYKDLKTLKWRFKTAQVQLQDLSAELNATLNELSQTSEIIADLQIELAKAHELAKSNSRMNKSKDVNNEQ